MYFYRRASGTCSHFGSSASVYCGAAMPYALCKHGPSCPRPLCGFAHDFSQLAVPPDLRTWHRGRWVDESHVSGRPASIDIWYGQCLTQSQVDRLWQYIGHANFAQTSMPDWVCMFMWFFGHPAYEECEDPDFNFASRVSGASSVPAKDWEPVFRWELDGDGMSLQTRLRLRQEDRVDYNTYSVRDVLPTDVLEGLRASTDRMYGRDSTRYVDLCLDQTYVRVGVSTEGWWWVYPVSLPSTGYGWADPTCFTPTGKVVSLPRIRPGVYEPVSTAIVPYVPPAGRIGGTSSGMAAFLERFPALQSFAGFQCHVGVPALAVCFSDASVEAKKGFAVAWNVPPPPLLHPVLPSPPLCL